jgi:hypothetical protein
MYDLIGNSDLFRRYEQSLETGDLDVEESEEGDEPNSDSETDSPLDRVLGDPDEDNGGI